ncbi:MAG: tetratricopeptide repeat protein [Caldilineaceae bacterium]|nr:tetratricopeptide repeat protein [Caldilineaceae bacterium]
MSGQTSAALHQFEVCGQRLITELGVEPQPATKALVARIRSGELVGDPTVAPRAWTISPQTKTRAPIHVPQRPASFLGRERELALVATRLADPTCRLLTILGPGGMGKTWLAISAAHALNEPFQDGVWFVDLTAVDRAEEMAGAIGLTLGLPRSGPGTATTRLLAHLRTRAVLLLLDNFEHLLDGADLLTTLMEQAPQVKLLITSRVRLQLTAEWLLPLGGLELPPAPPSLSTVETSVPPDIRICASVRLFLRTATHVKPDFQPSNQELAQIGQVCHLLEGMPLGIEMAAAWVRTLSPAEIGDAIRRGLDLFTTTLRDVSDRHRSMHAVFDRSWQMLTVREQSLLRQLAVFRGGFTLAAAAAVAKAAPADIEDLTDKSWLRADAPRFTMHELMRQYCLDQLAQAHTTEEGEDVTAVHRRHCLYFAEQAAAAERTLNWQSDTMDILTIDFGNLDAAWQWALAHGEWGAIRRMTNSLFYVAEATGWFGLMLPFFDGAVAVLRSQQQPSSRQAVPPTAPDAENATVIFTYLLYVKLVLFLHLGWYTQVCACLDEMRIAVQRIVMGESRQEQEFLVDHAQAGLDVDIGNYARAHAAARQQLVYLQTYDFPCYPWRAEIGTRFWQMHVHALLSGTARRLGDYDTTAHHIHMSINLCSEIGESRFRARNLSELAELLRLQGTYLRAARTVREARDLSRSFRDRINAAYAVMTLGEIELDQGSFEQAATHLQASLALALETGEHVLHIRSLTKLARCARMHGDLPTARTYLDAATYACGQPEVTGSVQRAGIALERGLLACDEGRWHAAREHLEDALTITGCDAAETQETHLGQARVAIAEHDLQQAVDLLTDILAHPATSAATRRQAEQELSACRAS